jgi:hypothetical protein
MATELTDEEKSKDAFFQRIALIGEEMIAAHGREFAVGAFVLAARWISEGRMGAKITQRTEAQAVQEFRPARTQ